MSFAEIPSTHSHLPESLGTESEGVPSEETLYPRNIRLEVQDPNNPNLQDSLEARFAQTLITQVNVARQLSLHALQNPALSTTETERTQNLSEKDTRLYSHIESIIAFLALGAPEKSSFKKRIEGRSLPEHNYIGLFRSQMLLIHGLLSGDRLHGLIDQKEKQTRGEVGEKEQENIESDFEHYIERINAMASTLLVKGEEETIRVDGDGLVSFLSRRGELDGMMHDVRNPLTYVDGNFQIVQRHPDRYPSIAPQIVDHLKRLATMVDECVNELPEDLSVKELGRMSYEHARGLVGLQEGPEAFEILSHMDEQIGGETTVRFSPSVLKRIVENLITNSQNALRGRPGERIFSMSATLSDNKEYAEFRFDDNGPGYQQTIVENGFVKAADMGIHGYASKDVLSEGTGMSATAVKIAKKFHGQFLPAQRIRRDGTMLPGARTILRLPRKK